MGPAPEGRTRRRRLAAAAVAWLGLGLPAVLAEPPADPPPEAEPEPAARVSDEITVAARRPEPRDEVTAAVTVLTREDLERLPARDLAGLLDYLPGVRMLAAHEWSGTPMASARGFFGGGDAGYLQLRLDGVPLADAETGVADWRRVRLADVERVEVLRGAGSSLYGDTALGGVVRVVTRHGGLEPGGSAELAAGSFDTGSADVSWRGGGRRPLGVAGSFAESDGFRDHAASERWHAVLAWRGPLGRDSAVGRRFRLQLAAESRQAEEAGTLAWDGRGTAGLDLSASDPLFRFDLEETGRLRAAFGADGLFGPRTESALLAWAESRETDWLRTLRLAPGFADRAARAVDGERFGASLEAAALRPLGGRAGRLSGGIELARETIDTSYRAVADDGRMGETLAAADARRLRLGGFLSQSWHPAARLRLDAGVRWDSIDDSGPTDSRSEAWSPRLAANLRLGPEAAPWVLHLRLARSFKAATLDQLFDPRPLPGPGGGSFTLSNPDISPQRARTVEAGLSRRGPWGSFELVGYRTTVDDEIDFDPRTFRFGNVGRTRHHGVEAAGRWRPAERWSPWADWTWTRVELAAGPDGNQLKNIPEHRSRLGLSARLPGELAADLVATRTFGRWFLDDANRVELPAATVVDLRLARQLGRVRLALDLVNLTDEEWLEVGFVLPALDGSGEVPFVLPASGRGGRLTVRIDLPR